MSMLSPLMQDPASPRLTVYDEALGTRMEFSGQTLENWANKVANMLIEEFDVEPGSQVHIDLPASWQSAAIALGTYNARALPLFDAPLSPPTVTFTTTERASLWTEVPDVVVVSNDPFGRGVVESGGELPFGTVDFGPTVRFYGDQYYGESADLSDFARAEFGPHRYLANPWTTREEFEYNVLAPLAAGGSVVVATGLIPAERLDHITQVEKVTHFLTAD
ncbi:TIGR03089 family protein [Corynebacterium riegelii]|uniref:TIGR03089 family protein n=1 Tax=Corynebacterium riegelii TaxID=156976 RepID=UPI00288C2953|nr:TIGR03089 family protein [Corynebacterium riegelii]